MPGRTVVSDDLVRRLKEAGYPNVVRFGYQGWLVWVHTRRYPSWLTALEAERVLLLNSLAMTGGLYGKI